MIWRYRRLLWHGLYVQYHIETNVLPSNWILHRTISYPFGPNIALHIYSYERWCYRESCGWPWLFEINIQQGRLAAAITSIKNCNMVKINFTQTYCRKDSKWIERIIIVIPRRLTVEIIQIFLFRFLRWQGKRCKVNHIRLSWWEI